MHFKMRFKMHRKKKDLKCCVPGCYKFKDQQLHKFPLDKALFDVWIDKVGRKDFKLKLQGEILRDYRVCNVHFRPEDSPTIFLDFDIKYILRENAVPTLFIPRKDFGHSEFSLSHRQLFRKDESEPTKSSSREKYRLVTAMNLELMRTLEQNISECDLDEEFCAVLFGEMSFDPPLKCSDKVFLRCTQSDGKHIYGCPITVDRATVFMVTGIFEKWKFPVAFFFSRGGMESIILAAAIKYVIKSCQDCGVVVKSLVCDKSSLNETAINHLYDRTHKKNRQKPKELFGFQIGNREIVPLYDPPNLLRHVRNSFFNGEVRYKWKTEYEEIASWSYLEAAYQFNYTNPDDPKAIRIFSHLSDHHLENSNETSVEEAAKIFYYNTYMLIEILDEYFDDLPKEVGSTASFILFMHKVFDSIDGAKVTSKIWRNRRTAQSAHQMFWIEAVKVFDSMKFSNDNDDSCTKNWIHTLRGITYLWSRLRKEDPFFILTIRRLNLSSLEKLFAEIKSKGVDSYFSKFMKK